MYSMNTVQTPPMRSPWHSPVPYLFGGLAAMLGLIAFALLILACSYWKFSHFLEDNNTSDRDLELGGVKSHEKPKLKAKFEENIVVIMAGHDKPTFLAIPVSSRASSIKSSCSRDEASVKADPEGEENVIEEGSGDRLHLGDMERIETSS